MVGIDKSQNLETTKTQAVITDAEDNELTEQQRKIFSLIQEKNELQQMLESITAEKEQLKTDLRENIEMVGLSTVLCSTFSSLCILDFYSFIEVYLTCHVINVTYQSIQSHDFRQLSLLRTLSIHHDMEHHPRMFP